MNKLCIIIPTYKSIKSLINCLTSLESNSNQAYDVYVVNQDSLGNEVRELIKKFNRVNIIQADDSVWWTGAINLGVKKALSDGFEYIALLNDDTEISHDYIQNVYNSTNKLQRAIIGSIVYSKSNRKQVVFCGGVFNKWSGLFKEFKIIQTDKDVYETDMLGGRGVVVSREVFNKLGLFDDKKFPHYAGDQDFWLRAKKAGIKVYINPLMRIFVDEKRTGVKISNIGVLKIFTFLFSKKYHANIITVSRFMFRHSCKVFSIFNIIYFYIYYFLKRKNADN